MSGTAGSTPSHQRLRVLAETVHHLQCPHCGQTPTVEGAALVCPRAHRFDLARQGYVNLLRGDEHIGTADTADMIGARTRFITAGHLAGLRDAITARAAATVSGAAGCLVEVGAGTGYHLAGLLDRLEGAVGLALDISKPALRRAARAHRRMAALGCDVWGRLPIADGAADLVLDIFAPRNAPELQRILRPGGALVVATPTSAHLAELVDGLGLLTVDARKEQRLSVALGSHFSRVVEPPDGGPYVEQLRLDHGAVADVAAMGPSARHIDRSELDRRLGALPDPLEVTLSVLISVWRRPPAPVDGVYLGHEGGG